MTPKTARATMALETSDPEVGLGFLLSQIGAYAVTSFASRLQPLDLTPQHVGILRLLALRPAKLTQTELASHLGVLPSRLVVLLDEIEQRGLLMRKPNPEDRRSNVLQITPEGVEAFGAVERVAAMLDEDMFDGLSTAKRSDLERTLKQVADQLGLKPGVHPSYRNHNEGH